MKSSEDIAWAAGIIEGEGCFTLHTNAPYLLIDMTDKDIIERLKEIFPTGTIRGPYLHKNKTQNKPRYRFDAYGTKALPIIKEIYRYMGIRRKERIDSLLTIYNKI